jgi:hypothetical protein
VTGPAEKRRTHRLQPYIARCVLRDDAVRVPGYLVDASPQGVRVSADAPPPAPGRAVTLEVFLRGRVAPVRLPADVVWVQSPDVSGAPHRVGLTLTGGAPADQAALDAALAEFRRRAAELG